MLSRVEKIKSLHEWIFAKMVLNSNKFNYDTVLAALVAFSIFGAGFIVFLIRLNFGSQVPYFGNWAKLIGWDFVWKLLNNTTEEISKMVFNTLDLVR